MKQQRVGVALLEGAGLIMNLRGVSVETDSQYQLFAFSKKRKKKKGSVRIFVLSNFRIAYIIITFSTHP